MLELLVDRCTDAGGTPWLIEYGELTGRSTARRWAWAAQLLLGGIGLALITFVGFQLGVRLPAAAFAFAVVITLVSLLGSYSASIALSFTAVACLNYFFAPPLFDFRVDSPEDVLAIVAFGTTSLVVSTLTARLRRSAAAVEEAQRALIDTVPAFVWTAQPDGSRDFHNRRLLEFTGDSAADAAGDGWADTFHPEDRADIVEKWRTAVASGEPFEAEGRLRSAAGGYRWILSRAAPLRDEKGAIAKWYGVTTDVEDSRRTMEKLRTSEAQLARVSRATTLGAMTAAIAHEVSQPLGAAIIDAQTALRWLGAHPPNLAKVGQALGRIIESAGRARDIIGRIRALVTKTPARNDRFDLNDAIRDAITLTRTEMLRRCVSLEARLTTSLPLVVGDRVQLQQVILNLVLNGVEAMDGIDETRELRISSRADGAQDVLVAVADSGPGLDEDDCNRVFEAFYTTKPEGMGLGLAICRSIIEAHGGRLWATPMEPRGAALQFTLPAAHDDAAAEHARVATPSDDERRPETTASRRAAL